MAYNLQFQMVKSKFYAFYNNLKFKAVHFGIFGFLPTGYYFNNHASAASRSSGVSIPIP